MTGTMDLNCDMGESFGTWRMGADAEVLPWVTSANIACGFHAGDPSTMRATVEAAVAAGVTVGAHVGLPDKEGFGRRAMAVSAREVHAMTVVQYGALEAMARMFGCEVAHLKPHGALYHMAEREEEIARAIVDAARSVDPRLRIVGQAGGRLVAVARALDMAATQEAFVDRRYRCDGSLVARSQSGAVIDDPDVALRQALCLARDGEVECIAGDSVRVQADTLCIHGDRAAAGSFARTIHAGLRDAGIALRAP